MILMKEFKEYLEATEGGIESKEINLTAQQIEKISSLAEDIDMSFEDMAMILLSVQLTELQAEQLQDYAQRN